MRMKKVVAVIVGVSVAFGAVAGGIYGYKSYQDKNLVVEVQPVSYINWGYWGDSATSYGMVTNDSSQEIYLSDTMKIKEIYVEEGDVVQEGDPLLAYDTAQVNLEIERKKLDISTIENNIAEENYKLGVLRQEIPVIKDVPKLNEEQLRYYQTLDEQNVVTEMDEVDNRVYNYLTENSIPSNVRLGADNGLVYPAGTRDDPYIFYCNENAYAYGSFYNSIRQQADGTSGKFVRFIVCKKDADGMMVTTVDADGNIVPEVDTTVSSNMAEIDGNGIPVDYEPERMWYVFSGNEYEPVSLVDQYLEEYDKFMSIWEMPEGYTEKELAGEIESVEDKLITLDIQKRQQQLQLETLQKSASDGIVYAEVDGVVKTVGDPDAFRKDGTAFMVVTGDDGLYVSGTISELLLEDVTIGTVVTANSWESGMTFDATITEISDYPVNGNSWGEGNPNVSYYSYTAYIEDSSALRNGEYVDLTISTNQSETGGLFIEKAYVREEDGKSYCMIADENGRLKKQYVVTGRTVYGSAIEIKSGLTEEDLIAFPYGKSAVEGVTVTEASDTYY